MHDNDERWMRHGAAHQAFRGSARPSQQGLGLHIAAEIAKAHGGTITVASDKLETRFTYVMPCRREDNDVG